MAWAASYYSGVRQVTYTAIVLLSLVGSDSMQVYYSDRNLIYLVRYAIGDGCRSIRSKYDFNGEESVLDVCAVGKDLLYSFRIAKGSSEDVLREKNRIENLIKENLR